MTLAADAPAVLRADPGDARDPRRRLAALFDPGTLELISEPDDRGFLAGTGRVEGAPVVAFTSDATVQGGAMGTAGCAVVLAAYERALAEGVPVVAAGTTEDKLEVNARVAYAGVGINLRTDRPEPAVIRSAVRRVLTDPTYARRARGLAAEIAAAGRERQAATLLEELAAVGTARTVRTDAVEA